MCPRKVIPNPRFVQAGSRLQSRRAAEGPTWVKKNTSYRIHQILRGQVWGLSCLWISSRTHAALGILEASRQASWGSEPAKSCSNSSNFPDSIVSVVYHSSITDTGLLIYSCLAMADFPLPQSLLQYPATIYLGIAVITTIWLSLFAMNTLKFHRIHQSPDVGKVPPTYPSLVPYLGIAIPLLWNPRVALERFASV